MRESQHRQSLRAFAGGLWWSGFTQSINSAIFRYRLYHLSPLYQLQRLTKKRLAHGERVPALSAVAAGRGIRRKTWTGLLLKGPVSYLSTISQQRIERCDGLANVGLPQSVTGMLEQLLLAVVEGDGCPWRGRARR